MKRYAQTLLLKDDPATIASYVEHHRAVWPEVERGLRSIGIQQMRIWRLGRTLFMVMETADSFDPALDWPRYLEMDPRIPEWQALMESFQSRAPDAKAGEWWAEMEPVYELDR